MIEQSRIKRLHFVGIGGAGMSGIAEVLFNMGFSVRGSDIAENDTVRRLRTLGVPVAIGHRAENLSDAEALIYSSAIDATNPEVAAALARKLPVLPRAEMLAELMRMKFALAIAGTHGKTTTTSMIARILTYARLDPTYVVGGRVKIGETGAALGSSRFLVAEADESDGSFLRLLPTIAVITNIENDHLDHYKSMTRLTRAFAEFADHVPFYGAVVLHTGCARVQKIVPAIHKRVITCGRRSGNNFVARNARVTPFSARFELVVEGQSAGWVELPIGGQHNIDNALCAIAAAREAGVTVATSIAALSSFSLPERRFQILLRDARFLVVDDYAHHPTEIKATLSALRSGSFARILAVFQPHRYTRLQRLLPQFARSFAQADRLYLAPLYTAGQAAIANVDSQTLAGAIEATGHAGVVCPPAIDELLDQLHSELRPGDAVVFLSAGNLTAAAHRFAARLTQEEP